MKAVATLKHFIGNNNEAGRGDTSVSLDPRNLREYYLKVFEITFKEGGAQSMMTAYNAVNGVPANLSELVIDIVKGEWGMNGFVVSDAFDVTGTMRDHHYVETLKEAVARSIREGGIDRITDDAAVVTEAIREALKDGLLTENDLDTALRNTFRVRFRLGEFDPSERNPYAAIDESAILHPEHTELAREAAQKAVVLLKNDGRTLPLQADKLSKVAVIGPLADVVYQDWYSGSLPYAVTPLQGIRERLAAEGKDAVRHTPPAPIACALRLYLADGMSGSAKIQSRLSLLVRRGPKKATFSKMQNSAHGSPRSGCGPPLLRMLRLNFDWMDWMVRLCKIPAGGERDWRSLTCGLTGVSGKRDVYVILDGPVSLSWFRMLADKA
ncbi:hypothetical protein J2T17_007345 [Paenibacillus mucilaginosus]